MIVPDGAWVLFHRLPGRSAAPVGEDRAVEERVRGRLLARLHEAATATGIADHAARSVIHGDFTPWNLLFDGGRLTGVLDFEATHHTFQVADFAMSWRGYHDNVLRGYDEVRALSDLEWRLIRPVFWAWLFLGIKDLLASHTATPAATPRRRGWRGKRATCARTPLC